MRKFKLTKTYPNKLGLEKGDICTENIDGCFTSESGIFIDDYVVLDFPEYWQEITEEPQQIELTPDKIVQSVIKKFNERSKAGIKKYGTTLEENNSDDFLNHLQEELMDAVNYIEKLKSLNNK